MTTMWHERWDEGRIGFHESQVNRHLETFSPWLLDGPKHRVLVPLAGKTVDISWLLDRGHEVVAVELVPKAVAEFHAESGRATTPTVEGPFSVWRSDGLVFLQGDIFAMTGAHVQGVDRMWDRAAMVALPQTVRERYVAHLRSVLAPSTRVLLSTFIYDQSHMAGPPFSVTDEEVQRAYDGAEVERVHAAEAIDRLPRWRERGLSSFQTRVHQITV